MTAALFFPFLAILVLATGIRVLPIILRNKSKNKKNV